MLFNSYIFLFLFLPVCLTGYFILNRLGRPQLALAFLFGMSLWFYGFFNPSYLTVISSSIVVNYLFYLLSKKVGGKPAAKWLCAMAVVINLSVLFYFKYFDFFISNINALFRTEFLLRNILLPLGISFFTFQQISFVVDAFRGEVPDYDFLSYACFVSFFPQLVAGPIVTHDELVPQLMDEKNRRFCFDNFAAGLFIFAIGLSKKVLIADTLGTVVDYCFAAVGDYRFEQINSASAWICGTAFTLQLYFDFSGYSDMAIGLGRMFNVKIPQNFNSPYKALNIVDFWKRWHLTLTRFFTKYVYIPLGGNRRGKARTYMNIMLVFFLSGLWHGANYTFIVWGLLHGIGNCLTRLTKGFWEKIPRFFGWLFTFLYVMFAYVFFRADNVKDGAYIIAKMLSFTPGPVHGDVLSSFTQPELDLLAAGLRAVGAEQPQLILLCAFLALCLFLAAVPKNSSERLEGFSHTPARSLCTALLLVWCIFSFAGVSTFLYFNF